MAFTILNKGSGLHDNQSEIDKVDIDILVAGLAGDGVVSGCAVTAQGVPDMTVAVAAGTVRIGGIEVTVTGGNVTIGAADATNPRFDLVVVNNAGTKSVVAGTAAAEGGTPGPVFPAIPANSDVLAAVYVPAADTAIGSTQITDKRVVVRGEGAGAGVTTDQSTTSTSYADLTTPGPAVTVNIGGSGSALVVLSCNTYNSGVDSFNLMSFAVSGATTLAASDDRASSNRVRTAGAVEDANRAIVVTGLNPGSNTFTAKYRVGSNTGNFRRRYIAVLPL